MIDPGHDRGFEMVAEVVGDAFHRAPSRLKSRIYSTLMLRAAETGPLASLRQSKECGEGLCVFEEFVRIAPVGEKLQHANYCRVCHARILGEKVENAPIYWPHCPYVQFQNR